MARKNVSDFLVCAAVVAAKQSRDLVTSNPYLCASERGRLLEWPYQVLQRWTGEPEKVCYRAMERAERRGLIEYGVSLRSGWLTEKGRELIRVNTTNKGGQ